MAAVSFDERTDEVSVAWPCTVWGASEIYVCDGLRKLELWIMTRVAGNLESEMI